MDEPPKPERVFADLSHWRKVAVDGDDAFEWLEHLVHAGVTDLAPNVACHAVLPGATGSVAFTVAVPGGSMVLLQDAEDPVPVERALAPHAGAAGIRLEDRTGAMALFALPGTSTPPNAPGAAFSFPSCLGPGVDLITLAEDHDRVARALAKRFRELTPEEVRTLRATMAGT
ncbi:MAG TPA: hypothetical protein VID47_11245 [Actinomycetota bacterium]|jgi:hypothetical protein